MKIAVNFLSEAMQIRRKQSEIFKQWIRTPYPQKLCFKNKGEVNTFSTKTGVIHR
jgi:hypothetical protein